MVSIWSESHTLGSAFHARCLHSSAPTHAWVTPYIIPGTAVLQPTHAWVGSRDNPCMSRAFFKCSWVHLITAHAHVVQRFTYCQQANWLGTCFGGRCSVETRAPVVVSRTAWRRTGRPRPTGGLQRECRVQPWQPSSQSCLQIPLTHTPITQRPCRPLTSDQLQVPTHSLPQPHTNLTQRASNTPAYTCSRGGVLSGAISFDAFSPPAVCQGIFALIQQRYGYTKS